MKFGQLPFRNPPPPQADEREAAWAKVLNRLDRLSAALEAQVAVLGKHADAVIQYAAATTAVADSHAQLLAALLAPDDEAVAPTARHGEDEMARTLEHTAVLGG